MRFPGKQIAAKKESSQGFVLLVALIITLAVGIGAVSLIGLTRQEYRLSMRSTAYSKALQAAESGANLACEALVDSGDWSSSWNTNGSLTNASGAVISSYSVLGGPSGSDSYVITSTGQVVMAGSTIQRVVRITVTQTDDDGGPPFPASIVSCQASIHMSGSVRADSYDSTDPTKSTNGQYDPAKATHNATLATFSTDDPAIKVDGGAQVDGISVMVVPVGAIVDIAHWIQYTGSIEYVSDYEVEDVEVPFFAPAAGSIDTGPWASRYQTISVSGLQNMSLKSLSVTADGSLTITGSGILRIYVEGKTTVSGSGKIQITPSPSTADLSVEIYANDDVSIAGSGLLNETYRPANCSIWGTENCTKVKVTGNSGYTGTIYAPYAEVDLTGSSVASGAFLGGAVKFTGNTRFYIDESLLRNPPSSPSPGSSKPYKLIEWTEL